MKDLFRYVRQKPKISAVVIVSILLMLIILCVFLYPVICTKYHGEPRHDMVRSSVRMNEASTANQRVPYDGDKDIDGREKQVKGISEPDTKVQEYLKTNTKGYDGLSGVKKGFMARGFSAAVSTNMISLSNYFGDNVLAPLRESLSNPSIVQAAVAVVATLLSLSFVVCAFSVSIF
jgi:hypothetical protein